MRYLTYLTGLLMAVVLTACGGGGGSAGTPSGGGGTGGTTTASIALSIVNAQNVASTSISVGGGYVARATVTNSSGAVVSGTLVTFELSGASIAALTPSTALTNAAGVAEVAIAPTSLTAIGAASLKASATVGTAAVSKQFDFSVAAAGLSLSPLTIASASLPSGGNTTVTTTALIAGVPSAAVPVNISFAASCGRINGQDTATGGVSVTTNGSGIASVSYTAVNASGSLCSGPVTITATSAGAATQTGTITVAVPVANAVTFVSATPSQIFVAGSGALEQSVVRFRVMSSVGTPLAGVSVTLSIAINPGGVGLNASGSTAPVTATSNETGDVSASLFSGTIPGPVKVRAELTAATTVFAESQNLTVASGPPSQRFMSLSVQTFNIEGWGIDGTTTKLTARIADRQGNAVDDGTVVNFTAEGGQVASSCATVKAAGISSCSVDFVSQNPRPQGGRVSVLAFTSGTKDYVDVNGNNKYDAGIDTLAQIGDAFRDDNENNTFDAGEFFVPRGGVLTCAGVGGQFPAKADTCDSNLATTVRQQAVILYSSSSPVISSVTGVATGVSFLLGSADNPLLPMPAGTVVSASSSVDGCTIGDVSGSPVANVSPQVGNPTQNLQTAVAIGLKGCVATNVVTVKITAPGGLTTSFPVTLR